MPKELEEKLKKQAKKKGYKGKRADKYVYGTMNTLGFMKGSKRTKKKYGGTTLSIPGA